MISHLQAELRGVSDMATAILNLWLPLNPHIVRSDIFENMGIAVVICFYLNDKLKYAVVPVVRPPSLNCDFRYARAFNHSTK